MINARFVAVWLYDWHSYWLA